MPRHMAGTIGPLTPGQVEQYGAEGYLAPVRVLSEEAAGVHRGEVEDHFYGRASPNPDGEAGAPSGDPDRFNIWKWENRFSAVDRRPVAAAEVVGHDPVIAGMARQLLGCEEVLLMEANPVVKGPGSGMVPWHQDYSYWPLQEPSAVTAWVALEHISASCGTLRVVPRSHRRGERLPVSLGEATYGDGGRTGPLGQSFMHAERPGIPEIEPDQGEGGQVAAYDLRPGECGFHHPLLWHSSTPNETDGIRCTIVLRYLASGTIWLGDTRQLYRDVGCQDGAPVDGSHFPIVRTAF